MAFKQNKGAKTSVKRGEERQKEKKKGAWGGKKRRIFE